MATSCRHYGKVRANMYIKKAYQFASTYKKKITTVKYTFDFSLNVFHCLTLTNSTISELLEQTGDPCRSRQVYSLAPSIQLFSLHKKKKSGVPSLKST